MDSKSIHFGTEGGTYSFGASVRTRSGRCRSSPSVFSTRAATRVQPRRNRDHHRPLLAMPVLTWLKRQEARRSGNAALAADATQSATCAYLALIALIGLAVNAMFHIAWFDTAAALAAVPILLKEGRSAWKGQTCKCC